MVEKLDEMEGKLNEQIEKNVALNRRLAESSADGIFGAVSEGLAALRKKNSQHLLKMLSLKVRQTIVRNLETLEGILFPK